MQINKSNFKPIFHNLMGLTAKYCLVIFTGNIIRILKLSLFMKKCYNIGKFTHGFYVNLANACTDITLEIHENCT